jgi:hypothetical protein
MTTEETYSEVEVQITAIETNIRSLLKDHPHAQQFIKILQNEAIDQAFREIHEDVQLIFATLDAHNKTLINILEILDTQRQQLEKLQTQISEIRLSFAFPRRRD